MSPPLAYFDHLSCACGASDDANGVWYIYAPTEDVILTGEGGRSIRVCSVGDCDRGLACTGRRSNKQTFIVETGVQYRFLVSRESFDSGSEFEIDVSEGTSPKKTRSAGSEQTPVPTEGLLEWMARPAPCPPIPMEVE